MFYHLDRLTHHIAHLSAPKLAVIFGLTFLASLFVSILPHPARQIASLPPSKNESQDSPIPPTDKTTTSSVLSQSISSSEATPVPTHSAKEVGLSVGESLLGLSDSDLKAKLADMKSLGVTWLRIDISWSSIQGDNSSSYDWSSVDHFVTTANSYGFKILPVLAYTPAWARPPGCSSEQCAPADPGRFAQFVGVAANRYKTKGIHTWEIWNEPNMTGFWQPRPNPAAYVALLRAAAVTIRSCDPSALIISGSLGSTDAAGGVPQLEFLQGVYKNGGKSYFDAVGFHPYSFPVLPSDYYDWNAWSQLFRSPTSIRSIMAANGDSGKSIWITEFGAPTGGPGSSATATDYNFGHAPDHVDEALQSRMITAALADYKETLFLGNFFWYSYQDNGTSNSTSENFYGLRHSNGTPKPAYQIFKSTITSLKN